MKYPIGIQSFEKIRTDGYAYVDKTALIYKLADEGSYYFLSRPRRFGKSLLISTMDAYFSCRRDLFKGLAIEALEKDWTQHPIPIVYQSGYLTIKDYDPVFRISSLGFPNEEVSEGFLNNLLPYYTHVRQIDEKGYAKPFAKQKLFKVGVNFNCKKRCIDDWKVVGQN